MKEKEKSDFFWLLEQNRIEIKREKACSNRKIFPSIYNIIHPHHAPPGPETPSAASPPIVPLELGGWGTIGGSDGGEFQDRRENNPFAHWNMVKILFALSLRHCVVLYYGKHSLSCNF